MPNYSLILDTKFKPFSYQEMLAPVMAATQAHQALETEYGDLATKASVWERMANEQTDPYAYKMYKTYADDLETQAEQLARSGLSPASRKSMLNMKARYSSEILPIETAYKRREELAAEQRKAIAANPTLRYQRMVGQMSLDDFIRNPSLDYGESYSGALLTQQVNQAAANFQRALTDKGQLKKLGLPYQYERMLQYGATPAQVMAAMGDNAQQGDADAIRFLRGITDQVLQSSGVADWADSTTMREFRAFANQGLYSAIGQAKLDNFTDQAGLILFKDNLSRREIGDKGKDVEAATDLYYRLVPKSTVNSSKDTRQLAKDLKILKDLISNPELLNQSATRQVQQPRLINPDAQTNIWIDTNMGPVTSKTYSPYREALKDMSSRYGNINYDIINGKLAENNFSDIAQQIEKEIRGSAVREFSYKPNITQSDLIGQVIKENVRSYNRRSGKTGLVELKDNKRGKGVDINDINKYFTVDSDIEFDPDLGFIINATDSKGTRSAVLDTELIDDPSRTLSRTRQSIKIALDNGEDELATALIDGLMKVVYKKFNTLAKRQSNTFSKE